MTHSVKTADGGVFEPVLGEKSRVLEEHTRHEIDEWIARFPTGKQRSAVLSALRFTQEQNNGFLTPELMDGVAEYLKLPAVQVYEVATFYSMFETHPCGRHHVSICTNISCMLNGGLHRRADDDGRSRFPRVPDAREGGQGARRAEIGS
jgi:NADH:ubiquinone oxidoreductase subunit E